MAKAGFRPSRPTYVQPVNGSLKKYLRWLLPGLLLLSVVAGLILGSSSTSSDRSSIESYSQLTRAIEDGKIKEIRINPNRAVAEAEEKAGPVATVGVPTGSENEADLIRLAGKNDVEVFSEPLRGNGGVLQNLLRILPTLALVLLLVGLAAYQFGWISTVKVEESATGVSFDDVAGCGEAWERK